MVKKTALNRVKEMKLVKMLKSGDLHKSERLLVQMCNKNPDDTKLLLQLASVYGQMGNFIKVVEYANKVLVLDTKNTMALSYLGNVYTTQGKHNEAIQYYKQSLEVSPSNPAVLYNLAILYWIKKDLKSTLNVLNMVLSLAPEHKLALRGLAKLYSDQGYTKKSIENYVKLVNIDPENLELLMEYSQILAHEGRFDKAISVYKKCLSLAKNTVPIYIALAEIFVIKGDIDNVKKYADLALKQNPASIEAKSAYINALYRDGQVDKAYETIATLIKDAATTPELLNVYSYVCKHFDKCNEVIKLLESSLKRAGLTLHQNAALNFDLGRLYDRQADYVSAFKYYKNANDLFNTRFDVDSLAAFTDSVIEVYSKNNIKNLPSSNNNTDVPIFVVGMPRSGTSLVEQILSSHPHISGAGELSEIGDFARQYIPDELKHQSYPLFASGLSSEELNMLAEEYLNKLHIYADESTYITDKMPQNYLYLGLIRQLFPNAKVIHCVRSPLDTVLSIYFQYFSTSHTYSFDLQNIAHNYKQYQRLMKHWIEVLGLPILDVSYVDLVNQFEDTCRKAIDFLNLEWDESCLTFYRSNRQVTTASFDQVRSPIYKSSLERWKHYEDFMGPVKNILELND